MAKPSMWRGELTIDYASYSDRRRAYWPPPQRSSTQSGSRKSARVPPQAARRWPVVLPVSTLLCNITVSRAMRWKDAFRYHLGPRSPIT
jgi:hypothetical protein